MLRIHFSVSRDEAGGQGNLFDRLLHNLNYSVMRNTILPLTSNSHWITHICHKRSCAVCCPHNAPNQPTALVHQVCWSLTRGLQYGLFPINQPRNLKLPSNKLSYCSPPHQLCSISDGPDLRPHQVPRHIHPDLHRLPKVLMQVLRNKIINFPREEKRCSWAWPYLSAETWWYQSWPPEVPGDRAGQWLPAWWDLRLLSLPSPQLWQWQSQWSQWSQWCLHCSRNDHKIRLPLTIISSYRNLLLLLSNSRKCAHKEDIQQQQNYLEMRNCQY